ncbi:dipeptidase [Kallotenue papyrolyticum]|uniref:dipeptidase n=1 Tax=Kallotenue papyrolyticum TaxID=1325125 RepID=UPI000492687F|nr:dipeptidase [Kallotenue papyrolyticum]
MTTTDVAAALAQARAQHERYLDGFKTFLRIPSISTDPAYQAEIERAARWLVQEMERIGLEHCRIIPTAGHPVVYGDWLHAGADRPTVLIYAHYDVQPVDPRELWHSDPFEPVEREGKLFARGAIDDKVGVFVNLKALEAILSATGRLPVNVKLLFEGEEEMGSPHMTDFVREQRELLAADLLLISDGGSEPDQPVIDTALRGIVAAEVTVSGPSHDLHSGTYGGIVHNPAHLVGRIIAALHDANGRVAIPGFYDDVAPLSAVERELLAAQEAAMRETLQQQAGVRAFWGPAEATLLERATALPTCDVNGLYGGYAGPGGKTIIPARAGFKVSMRLVPNQDPQRIAEQFSAFVRQFATETLDVEVQILALGWWARLLTEGRAVEALKRAYVATWGKAPALHREGGSIPVMGAIQRELGLPMTTLGHGIGRNVHAPNEFLYLEYFGRGIATTIHFLYNLAELADGRTVI